MLFAVLSSPYTGLLFCFIAISLSYPKLVIFLVFQFS